MCEFRDRQARSPSYATAPSPARGDLDSKPHVRSGFELAIGNGLVGQHFSYLVPHICGHRVCTGTTDTRYQLLEHKFSTLATLTVDTDFS